MLSAMDRPEMLYDRQIRYLDYIENGERCCGAGFLKLERRNDRCKLQLQVCGQKHLESRSLPVFLVGQDKCEPMQSMEVRNGVATLCLENEDCADIAGSGIAYEKLCGVRIPVSEKDGKEIVCIWRKGQTHPKAAGEPAVSVGKPEEEREEYNEVKEEKATAEEAMPEKIREKEEAAEEKKEDEKTREKEEPRGEEIGNLLEGGMRNSKWEQLWEIYPHHVPFGDDREYLLIEPADFVILSDKSYPLVNNSFLLHSFCEYEHIVLRAVEKRDGNHYYVGVPGKWNEKEKKTAILYEFESFECRQEPAKENDFGYYMIPVAL